MTDPTDSTGPKVVDLAPKNEYAAVGDSLRRNFDTLVANQKTIAQLRRAAFVAYVDAGFTDAQALELCCK